MADIFVNKTVAANSNLCIDMHLIGATCNLAITKLQWIFPVAFTSLIYTTCPYPFSEASEKWCKLQLTTWPNPSGLYHLLSLISLSMFKLHLHFAHFFWISSSTGLSQAGWLWQNICMIRLPSNKIGKPIPKDHILNSLLRTFHALYLVFVLS